MNDASIRAAQYVRTSTEHQQYSTENQSDVLREYAKKRGFEIVRTFIDAGKSGLHIDGRDELNELIADVQSGAADFGAILVTDRGRERDAKRTLSADQFTAFIPLVPMIVGLLALAAARRPAGG
jgi:DNA invertase Pin-like site-specific DNA recombinase